MNCTRNGMIIRENPVGLAWPGSVLVWFWAVGLRVCRAPLPRLAYTLRIPNASWRKINFKSSSIYVVEKIDVLRKQSRIKVAELAVARKIRSNCPVDRDRLDI